VGAIDYEADINVLGYLSSSSQSRASAFDNRPDARRVLYEHWSAFEKLLELWVARDLRVIFKDSLVACMPLCMKFLLGL